jgi:lipopolysaccharide biosynthesis glycosyltransferase
MDIAFAFDEGYADPAQVAIESVMDSNRGRSDLTFWILTTDAVAAQRSGALRRQVNGRARVRVLTAGDGYRSLPLSQQASLGYISAAAYLRLFLPDLMPPEVRRLVYLDSDVIVFGDLSPLWDVALDAAPFAAVAETFPLGDRGGIPGAGPEHDPTAPYFNTGVLLMNLPVWRAMRITERCLVYLHQQADQLRMADQDALNLVGYGRWIPLPRRWNWMLYLLESNQDPVPADEVSVIHFLGPNKPWIGPPRRGYGQDRYHALAAVLADRTSRT